uniref:Uncharacterized protein n=1 Tax=Anguilla anguilla TaxID=7936 RepID=A0A0E9PN59_ANGAN
MTEDWEKELEVSHSVLQKVTQRSKHPFTFFFCLTVLFSTKCSLFFKRGQSLSPPPGKSPRTTPKISAHTLILYNEEICFI